jgi:hypothetical protein
MRRSLVGTRDDSLCLRNWGEEVAIYYNLINNNDFVKSPLLPPLTQQNVVILSGSEGSPSTFRKFYLISSLTILTLLFIPDTQ